MSIKKIVRLQLASIYVLSGLAFVCGIVIQSNVKIIDLEQK